MNAVQAGSLTRCSLAFSCHFAQDLPSIRGAIVVMTDSDDDDRAFLKPSLLCEDSEEALRLQLLVLVMMCSIFSQWSRAFSPCLLHSITSQALKASSLFQVGAELVNLMSNFAVQQLPL